jgi:hypothetical protein
MRGRSAVKIRGTEESNTCSGCTRLVACKEAMDCPIPGTTKLERLEENLGALNIKLTADDLSAIETASSHIKIEGNRYPEFHEKLVGP